MLTSDHSGPSPHQPKPATGHDRQDRPQRPRRALEESESCSGSTQVRAGLVAFTRRRRPRPDSRRRSARTRSPPPGSAPAASRHLLIWLRPELALGKLHRLEPIDLGDGDLAETVVFEEWDQVVAECPPVIVDVFSPPSRAGARSNHSEANSWKDGTSRGGRAGSGSCGRQMPRSTSARTCRSSASARWRFQPSADLPSVDVTAFAVGPKAKRPAPLLPSGAMTWPVAFRGIESVLRWSMREEDKLSLPLSELCAPLAADVGRKVSIPVDDPTFPQATLPRGLSAACGAAVEGVGAKPAKAHTTEGAAPQRRPLISSRGTIDRRARRRLGVTRRGSDSGSAGAGALASWAIRSRSKRSRGREPLPRRMTPSSDWCS